jgi:hypothetical protein
MLISSNCVTAGLTPRTTFSRISICPRHSLNGTEAKDTEVLVMSVLPLF